MRIQKTTKLIALFLIVSVTGTSVPVLSLFQKEVHAQFGSLFAVPTYEEFGNLSSVNEVDSVGQVTEIVGQPSLFINETLQSQNAAAIMKTLLKYVPAQLADIENQATADVSADQSALVNASEFTEDLYRVNSLADEAVANPLKGEIPGDVNVVYNDFLNKDIINKMQVADVQRKAYQQYTLGLSSTAMREALIAQMQTLAVGATTQFASSIACGGIDSNALRNAGNFLAVASTGVLRDQINSSLGLDYYRQMALLGTPNSVPDYWTLVWQDAAMRHEAAAHQAAATSFVSPGLKVPTRISQEKVVDPKTGKEKIKYRLVPAQTVDALQNYTALNYRSLSDGLTNLGRSAAVDFVTYDAVIGALYATSWLLKNGTSFLKKIPVIGGVLSEVLKYAGKIEKWKGPVINVYAGRMAAYVVQFYVRKMMDVTINRIFRGKMLAGSYGCRQKARLTDFKSSVDTSKPLVVPDLAPPGTSGGSADKKVVLYIRPSEITTPEALADGVFLEWDASMAGIGLTEDESLEVILSGGRFGTGQVVSTTGNDTDTPQVTTTYALTANAVGSGGSRFIDSASATVTINIEEPPPPPPGGPDFSQVQFDVKLNGESVRSVSADTVVDVVWDASAIAGAQVIISSTGAGPLSTDISGSFPYVVRQTETFSMVTTAAGEDDIKAIGVSVLPPRARGAFIEAQGFQVRE